MAVSELQREVYAQRMFLHLAQWFPLLWKFTTPGMPVDPNTRIVHCLSNLFVTMLISAVALG